MLSPGTFFTFNLLAVEHRDEGRLVAASKLKVKNVPYAHEDAHATRMRDTGRGESVSRADRADRAAEAAAEAGS